MEKYVNQLISDLKDVLKTSIPVPYVEIPPEMEDVPEIAEFECAIYKPMSEWCGIELKVFPAEDLLIPSQMKQLASEMCKLFEKINVQIDFPGKMSETKRYSLLLELWDQPVPYLSAGGYHLDFLKCDM